MNAVTLHEAGSVASFADVERMAEQMAAAKLFGTQTKQQILSLMLIAQANGQHPAAAARDYDVIQGRPSKKAEAMLRDFLTAGGSVQWHAYTDAKCDATFSHPQGGSVRVDWDMKRVKQAKISNEAMYSKYPRNMFRARCISEGVRTVYPVATGGLQTPEETRGLPVRDMGAAEIVAPPELIEAANAAADAGRTSFATWWKDATPSQREQLRDEIPELQARVTRATAPDPFVVEMEAAEAVQEVQHADH